LLGPIYAWAGEYRSVDIGKGGFQFAHAPLIPGLMAELQRGALKRLTPCRPGADSDLALALAEVHSELILVHPFRDGNGRLARLVALLMALQAGLPPLDFSPFSGRGRRAYIGGIQAALGAITRHSRRSSGELSSARGDATLPVGDESLDAGGPDRALVPGERRTNAFDSGRSLCRDAECRLPRGSRSQVWIRLFERHAGMVRPICATVNDERERPRPETLELLQRPARRRDEIWQPRRAARVPAVWFRPSLRA